MGWKDTNTGPKRARLPTRMTDETLEFAEERGLGKPNARVRLDGELRLANGGRARATLLLTKSGLWLAAARSRFDGLSIDLLARADLRLESGRIRDRLCFGHEALAIPAGRRHAVEHLIALGRFATEERARRFEPQASRLVHAPDELGRAWLARELAAEEVLVGWLEASNRVTVESHLIGASQCRPHLFVSDRRAAIVSWSNVGDVTYTALDASTLSQVTRTAQTELSAPGALFLSRRSDAEATRDAFDLIALTEPKERLLEAARRIWLARAGERDTAARCLDLLHAAVERGSERARFARLFAHAEDSRSAGVVDRAELGRALTARRFTPSALGELWASWRFSCAAGSALVRGLLDLNANALPFALALQRRIRDVPSVEADAARDELRLARFAVETRLSSALHPDERDLTLRAVLAEQGLRGNGGPPQSPETGLSPLLIETTLRHPLARGHGSLVSGVQKLIALAPEPDQVALNDYCEALNLEEQPAASRALAAARLAYGLPNLRGYVSRGKKSIGLRGYDGALPYILLGKAHLDPNSPYAMSEAELLFAFGAEALHLKLGHTRLTSNEVWAGAFAHTKDGVELLLGLLPLAKGIPLGAKVSKVLERIPEPALRRGLDALIRFEHGRRKTLRPGANESALSLVNENLVAAHRLMQMSADRAGLVLCGDLRASLRSLLLVRPDYRALLDAMEQRDVVGVLVGEEADAAMRTDLIVRFAALLDFYASEDYLTLRAALHGA